MPQLSSGLVIAGAFADKVRRVLFAQLRDAIKRGEITHSKVAERAGELNRILFDIIVNRLKLDKGDAVRIRIEYELADGDIKWKLETLKIEAFRRIPDEEVEKAIREAVEKAEEVLAKPVTEEERAWTAAKPAPREAKPAPIAAPKASSATPAGETRSGEKLVILLNDKGEKIGLAVVRARDSGSELEIILVHGKEAYHAQLELDEDPDTLVKETDRIVDAANKASYRRIERREAEEMIRKRLEELY